MPEIAAAPPGASPEAHGASARVIEAARWVAAAQRRGADRDVAIGITLQQLVRAIDELDELADPRRVFCSSRRRRTDQQ
jgi:hypothetical protein